MKVRSTVIWPGSTGIQMLARLLCHSFPLLARKSAAVSSRVSAASPATVRSMRPDPMSKTSAGVTPSSLTTPSTFAVIMRAERTCDGVQSGCRSMRSAAAPATWGEDIDVPWIAWKSSPGLPLLIVAPIGVLPARIWTPGAVTSGLIVR